MSAPTDHAAPPTDRRAAAEQREPHEAAGPNPTSVLLGLVAPVRGRLVLATALGGLSAVLRVAGLLALADLVRVLLVGEADTTAAWWRVGIALAAVLLAGGTKALASSLSHHAAFDHEVILRRQLVDHLGRLPLGVVQRIGAGGLKKVVQDDVRGLHAAVADSPPALGSYLVGPIAALTAMFWIEWRLALVALAVVPLVIVVTSVALRDYADQRAAYDAAQEAVNAAVVEYVQGMAEVRTFDAGSDSFARFDERVQAFSERVRRWSEASRWGRLAVVLLIAPLPVIVVVAVAGGAMQLAGWIGIPELVAVLLLCPLPVEAALPLMWMSDFLNRSKASAQRIGQVLDEPPLPESTSPRQPQDGSVRLSGVTFAYDDRREPALRDVDLDIPAGTVCALVGPSGSGKSTVARLIPRFFDVDAGCVEVGGVDVRDIDPRVLLRQVALVFQEPMLLHATVWENLTLGHPQATEQQVEQAARAAEAHGFVTALPDGYDTVIGERGATLSGGQRQRLTIARALLSDAPVVVLDEATAFTDPENEAAIQAGLAELVRGRTVIVVAHRLSTIVDADQIVVLDEGRVAEHGRHEQLLEAGGRYAALWERHQRAQRWGLRLDDRPSSEVSS
jgi:ATP-binding cassette subfamily B protein IrtA